MGVTDGSTWTTILWAPHSERISEGGSGRVTGGHPGLGLRSRLAWQPHANPADPAATRSGGMLRVAAPAPHQDPIIPIASLLPLVSKQRQWTEEAR